MNTNELREVELAEEGTPLAIFQKERTDAISEMFDTKYANGIYPTSRFFARLDKCFSDQLSLALAKRDEEETRVGTIYGVEIVAKTSNKENMKYIMVYLEERCGYKAKTDEELEKEVESLLNNKE
jgi:hypothetical protein